VSCAFERTRDRCSASAVVICPTCRTAVCSAHAGRNAAACPRCGVEWFASPAQIAAVNMVFSEVLADPELSTKRVRDLVFSAHDSLGVELTFATSRRARSVAKRIALEAAFARGAHAEHMNGTYGVGAV
jgi:hypothetical protein